MADGFHFFSKRKSFFGYDDTNTMVFQPPDRINAVVFSLGHLESYGFI